MSDYTYDPQKIYHELLTNGDDWADKKAAYEVLNDVTKSILASLKDPTISDAKATTEALAHPTYRQHLRSLGEARSDYLKAQVLYDSTKVLADARRTQQATLRSEHKHLP